MKTYKTFRDAAEAVPEYIHLQLETQSQIARRLNLLIKGAGITQKQASKDLGMSESQLSWILSGEDNLTIRTISKFESYFGKPVLSVVSTKEAETSQRQVAEPGKKYDASANE